MGEGVELEGGSISHAADSLLGYDVLMDNVREGLYAEDGGGGLLLHGTGVLFLVVFLFLFLVVIFLSRLVALLFHHLILCLHLMYFYI